MKIAIYCGASLGNKKIYKEKALDLVHFFKEKNCKIVYGGSKSGLMGVISEEAIKIDVETFGVITHDLANKELENNNITKLYKVDTIRERKAKMEELADCFIAMPGGFGTIEEITEIFTSIQICKSGKPAALYNINGFYDKFIEYLRNCEEEGFLLKEHLDSIIVSDDIKEIYTQFKEYKPPRDKWDILSNKLI